MAYAEKTSVPIDRSKSEIEKILNRYGASDFGYMSVENGSKFAIMFRIKTWTVQITFPMPDKKSKEFTHDTRGWIRSENAQQGLWEQACRARWRAMVLIIKAKLEAVESKVSTIEREFFVDIVMPDGGTVGERLLPQISAAYEEKGFPKLLPNNG